MSSKGSNFLHNLLVDDNAEDGDRRDADAAFKQAQLARDLAEIGMASTGGMGDDGGDDLEEEEERIRALFASTKKAGEQLFHDGPTAGDSNASSNDEQPATSSQQLRPTPPTRVRMEGKDVPPAITLFQDVGSELGPQVMHNIEMCKYERPTPIQRYSLPVILGGRDMLATAQTGSGKTAAFLLPIIANMLRHGTAKNPHGRSERRGGGGGADTHIDSDDDDGEEENSDDDDDDGDDDGVEDSGGEEEDMVFEEDSEEDSDDSGDVPMTDDDNVKTEEETHVAEKAEDEEHMHRLVEEEGALVSLDPALVCYPTAVILAPTRELAHQIYEESLKFSYGTGLRSLAVIGGASRSEQMAQILKRGCDIVVATPGRLVDFLRMGYFNFSGVRYLCMDEADRMLDFGFDAQIDYLIRHGPITQEQRQTLMFSATFTKEVQYLALHFLKDYAHLTVGDIGRTSDLITQQVMFVKEQDKAEQLLTYLAQTSGLTIVFCARKVTIMQLEDRLREEGLTVDSLHGDKDQIERAQVVTRYKAREFRVLIATDIAARGLDVDNVEHVVNYDFPQDFEQYVHRIGRTGRAGRSGTAMTFFNYEAQKFAPYLWQVLEESGQPVPKWLRTMARNRKKNYQRESDMLILKQGRESKEELETFVRLPKGASSVSSNAKGFGFQFGVSGGSGGDGHQKSVEAFELDLVDSDNDDDDDGDGNEGFKDSNNNVDEKRHATGGLAKAGTSLDPEQGAQKHSSIDDRQLMMLERDKALLREKMKMRRTRARIASNLRHIEDPQKRDMLLSFNFPLNLNHVAKLTADTSSDVSKYMRPEQENEENPRTVHIFSIPGKVEYAELRRFLFTAGRIVRMAYSGTNQWHRRYAKVTFETNAVAIRAIQYLQKIPINGTHRLNGMILHEGQVLKVDHRVIELFNMHENVTEQELRALYEQCGKITFINIWKHRDLNRKNTDATTDGKEKTRKRGESVRMVSRAYIEFTDELHAQRAMSLDATLHGVPIRSTLAHVVFHGSYNGRTVRVSNLDSSADEIAIRQFFIHCGKITNVAMDEPLKIAPETRTALLRFRTSEEALRACWMSNLVLGKFPVHVNMFTHELHHIKSIFFHHRFAPAEQGWGAHAGDGINDDNDDGLEDMPEAVRFIRAKIDSRAYDFYNKHLAELDHMHPRQREELQENRRARYENFRLSVKKFKKARKEATRAKRMAKTHNNDAKRRRL